MKNQSCARKTGHLSYNCILRYLFKGHEATLKAFEKWTLDNGGYQVIFFVDVASGRCNLQ